MGLRDSTSPPKHSKTTQSLPFAHYVTPCNTGLAFAFHPVVRNVVALIVIVNRNLISFVVSQIVIDSGQGATGAVHPNTDSRAGWMSLIHGWTNHRAGIIMMIFRVVDLTQAWS